jgi:acylaminoacyl-peptidase
MYLKLIACETCLLSSPDGRFLVFLSGRSSVDSGAHSATDSLHRIDWPVNGQLSSLKIIDVVSSSCLSV